VHCHTLKSLERVLINQSDNIAFASASILRWILQDESEAGCPCLACLLWPQTVRIHAIEHAYHACLPSPHQSFFMAPIILRTSFHPTTYPVPKACIWPRCSLRTRRCRDYRTSMHITRLSLAHESPSCPDVSSTFWPEAIRRVLYSTLKFARTKKRS